MTIDAAALHPLQTTPGPEKASHHQTASDFEALLIGQMLKSARSESTGWFGTGEDTSSASLIEMAEEQIAKVLAQGGGLGLATTVERTLDQASGSSTVQMSGKLR